MTRRFNVRRLTRFGGSGYPGPQGMKRRSSRAWVLVGFMVLLSMGALIAEESFVHTDDGCAVEVHCLACRLALGSTGVLALAIGLHTAIELVGYVGCERTPLARDGVTRVGRSRAPPLA